MSEAITRARQPRPIVDWQDVPWRLDRPFVARLGVYALAIPFMLIVFAVVTR